MAVEAAAKPAMWPVEFYRSQLGKKVVMAVTGIIGFGFILGHMLGNLKLYLGAAHLNEYGEWLRDVGQPAVPRGGLLWLARAVLVGAIVLHVHAAYALTRINHTARPTKYESRDYIAANYASRTMRWGGVIILLFIAFHLADLTWGVANPHFIKGNVYNNVIVSFQRWPVAGLYIVANLALGLHLFHGLWSMFQTMGWSHDRFDPWRRNFAIAFALLITVGNVSFPIAVLTGAVG